MDNLSWSQWASQVYPQGGPNRKHSGPSPSQGWPYSYQGFTYPRQARPSLTHTQVGSTSSTAIQGISKTRRSSKSGVSWSEPKAKRWYLRGMRICGVRHAAGLFLLQSLSWSEDSPRPAALTSSTEHLPSPVYNSSTSLCARIP